MKLPFSPDGWAETIKEKCSAVNATLDYRNLQSVLARNAEVFSHDYLGESTYCRLVDYYEAGCPVDDANSALLTRAVDALQRAMLHFTIADNLIYLIAQIGNDGVTVRKTDESTTLYKYQQDQLREQLMDDAHFWLERLLELVENNRVVFADYWNEVSLYDNFRTYEYSWVRPALARYAAIKDESFIRCAKGIIVKQLKELQSHVGLELTEPSDSAQQAFACGVTADAFEVIPYVSLPKNLRLEITNEQRRTTDTTDENVRLRRADYWRQRANNLWQAIDVQQQRLNRKYAVYCRQWKKHNSKFAVL